MPFAKCNWRFLEPSSARLKPVENHAVRPERVGQHRDSDKAVHVLCEQDVERMRTRDSLCCTVAGRT